nr:FMN-binding glutamate synthase family protein [Protofrankia symbiont of Coriaria ruscifolia]
MVGWTALGIVLSVCAVALYDLVQRQHSILRTFPVVGHLRFLLEDVGPELRQYIVTSNDEERPFSRDQRRWVYATAKQVNASFGFGTDNDLEQSANYLIIKPAVFPLPAPAPDDDRLECRKVLGAARGRTRAFRPPSVVNVSGMSFGALSASAIVALNEGSATSGCLHNTGEGGVSEHHLHGGDLVFQIGTGYFGCRAPDGRFSLERLVELVERHPIRALEIKLSQGAKPGIGGVLPAAKVTPEIARIRGVRAGETCISPSTHSAFSDVDSMLDTVEEIAAATGLPVGIKSAVGELGFWEELADQMVVTGRGVDFVTIDGGEGGTGAAPLAFSDHVALPFKLGFSRVHGIFTDAGLDERIVFVGSAKLGFPESALLAMAMGCDLINVGREAMLALGCIQAQRCHTGRCPTGVATQSRWLARGLDPHDKAARVANYVSGLRHELLRLAHACAVSHPALVTLGSFEILDGHFGSRPASEVFSTPGAGNAEKRSG